MPGIPFINGRDQIERFLTVKWAKEHDYRLIKELWAFEGNRIAVRFAYEWHNEQGPRPAGHQSLSELGL